MTISKTTTGPAETSVARAIIPFFRSLGLQLISALSFYRTTLEPRKVALHKSRRAATLRNSIHVLPLLIAVAIINLNPRPLHVKRQEWFPLLQFMAKLHEILMQASVAAMLMAYIRHGLLEKQRLAFGTIFAGLQISSISYLWSLDFIGALRAKWMPLQERLLMACLIVGSFMLASAVGPSSAILLGPRPGIFPLGAASIAVASLQPLFPSYLDANHVAYPQYEAVFGGHLTVKPLTLGDGLLGPYELPRLAVWNSSKDLSWIKTHSALPADWVSDVITSAAFHTDLFRKWMAYNISVDSKVLYETLGEPSIIFESRLASAKASCGQTIGIEDKAPEDKLTFTSNDETFVVDISYGDISRAVRRPNQWKLVTRPAAPELQGDGSLFLVSVTNINLERFGSESNSSSGSSSPLITSCALSLSWPVARFQAKLVSATGEIIVKWLADGDDFDFRGESMVLVGLGKIDPFEWSGNAIRVEPGWVESLTFETERGRNVTSQAVEIIEQWMENVQPVSKQLGNATEWLIGTAISSYSSLIASAMASLTCKELGSMGIGQQRCPQDAIVFLTQSDQFSLHNENATVIRVNASSSGIGYNMNTAAPRLAAGVLMLYCLAAIAFIVWSTIFAVSSNSWDSPSEVTALALASKCPGIDHTSAGLTTLSLYRESVAVQQSHTGSLELVFTDRLEVDSDHKLQSVGHNEAH